MIRKGSVCVVTSGRYAGRTVIVTEVIDDLFVKAKGKGIKERRFNKRHLLPTGKVVEDVEKALEELA
ncbi:MAG: 50S ribosomal protein L14e [Candidatus Diapherotrites archaeon]|nr:50S ribosomal protein L14e [Candidatus Diapherotrites archaeon]